jgi:hypothetical protein
MLILKYFLFVGAGLLVLLYGWTEYLQPAGTKPPAGELQAVPPPAALAVMFRPTPVVPVATPEPPPSAQASEPPATTAPSDRTAEAPRAKSRRQHTIAAHHRASARRSFASALPRQTFFGWR